MLNTKRLLHIIFIFYFLFSVPVTSYSQNSNRVVCNNEQITIINLIKKIEKQTEYTFVFDNTIPLSNVVNIKAGTYKVETLLDQAFGKNGITYQFVEKQILLKKAVVKQPRRLSGVVVDDQGKPIIGATVKIKKTGVGTITNVNGEFTLSVVDNAALEVSYIGYETKHFVVNNHSKIQIVLKEDVKTLGEVVVTALGIKREEKALGYAVQGLKGDVLQTVKGVDVGTSLTGKIAGVNVLNSTEFGEGPQILVRGEEPLLVIDGTPYANMTLREVPSDDIESLSVLKGATASALYGSRGQNGAIMITTKKGSGKEGLSVSINSGTMFTAGYLAIPKMQSTYGRVLKHNPDGTLEYVTSDDGSWGSPLEGQDVIQWDPVSKSKISMPFIARGKNNFKNFLEQGYVLNNNVSISQTSKNGNIRASVTWVKNKGNYPNSTYSKYIYSLGGDIKLNDFSFSTSLSYNKHESPNLGFSGYTAYDPMYSLLVWSSPDWDLRDYKDYWVIPNQEQNCSYTSGNNNPYFDRYERIHKLDKDIFNGTFEIKYEPTKWLNSMIRVGYDTYSNKQEIRISKGSFTGGGSATVISNGTQIWGESARGSYNEGISRGYSINMDFITSANYKYRDFTIDGFVGASMMYNRDEGIEARTKGGLSVPGFYSLLASVDPASVASQLYKKQTNSLYGKLGISWKSIAFAEITLRNDWVSTLPESTRSYLYPSFSGSLILSDLLPKLDWLSLWKIRGSWVESKKPADIYDINSVYSISNSVWGALSSSSLPTVIRGTAISPEKAITYEVGTAVNLFNNRVSFDFAYYNKRMFDFIEDAGISPASGYLSTFVNSKEVDTRRGLELTINATPVKTNDLIWNVMFNWSKYADYYTKLDPVYSADKPWVKVGKRTDAFVYRDYLRDTDGNIIHNSSGLPQYSNYDSKYGNSDPDWIWGLNNSIKYKNWELSVSFDGRVGGHIQSITEMYMWRSGNHPKSVTPERYLDATNPGSNNYVGKGVKIVSGTVKYDTYGNIIEGSDTRVFAPNDIATTYKSYIENYHRGTAWGGTPSAVDIYSGTFFKLRELSLTYNVPFAFCNKFKAKSISISAIGQNVLFFAKDFKYSDPDGGHENFADPSQRYLGFNIKIGF
jgi:TonB-linked SusC/RagA family outer membrane protein